MSQAISAKLHSPGTIIQHVYQYLSGGLAKETDISRLLSPCVEVSIGREGVE